MALTTELRTQLQLREVAGIPLQASTVDNWSQIQNFEAKPDDLLICTYPKSGDCGVRGQPNFSLWSKKGLLMSVIIPLDTVHSFKESCSFSLFHDEAILGCLMSLGLLGSSIMALEDPDCCALLWIALG